MCCAAALRLCRKKTIVYVLKKFFLYLHRLGVNIFAVSYKALSVEFFLPI